MGEYPAHREANIVLCDGSTMQGQAGLANPVDMIATATAAQYRQAIGALAAWEGIDALVTIFIRPR